MKCSRKFFRNAVIILLLNGFLYLPIDIKCIMPQKSYAHSSAGLTINIGSSFTTNTEFLKDKLLPEINHSLSYRVAGLGIFYELPFFDKYRYKENLRIFSGINLFFGSNDGFINDKIYFDKVLKGTKEGDELLKYIISNDFLNLNIGISYMNEFLKDIIFSSGVSISYIPHFKVTEDIYINPDYVGKVKFTDEVRNSFFQPDSSMISIFEKRIQNKKDVLISINAELSYRLFSFYSFDGPETDHFILLGFNYSPLSVINGNNVNISNFYAGFSIKGYIN